MEIESYVAPEDLARSLIREFFLKGNYKVTLEAFEREDKRQRVKMNKIELIKLLSMERLIKNNKMKEQPQNTMLEILTDYLFSKYKCRQTGYQNGTCLTNTNQDDDQQIFYQNKQNQDFPLESVYGSQPSVQNKLTTQLSYNQNKTAKENCYNNSATNSNISNGNNISINSYLNSQLTGTSAGFNSQISNNVSNQAANSHWNTTNSNIKQHATNFDQKKLPKTDGSLATNAFGNQGLAPLSQSNKLPLQIKNPLQEKGADYLSILEEQSKQNKNNNSFKQQGNSSNYQNNQVFQQKENNQDIKVNSQNDNDNGEFKFESRRGNMKKVIRQPSNSRRDQQKQSEQVTQTRASLSSFNESNVQSIVTTNKNNGNSEFFTQFNDAFNQNGSQNTKLDFNDPIFGETNANSCTVSQIHENKGNTDQRPMLRLNKKSDQIIKEEVNQIQNDLPKEENDVSKQFNFFNKKKKQEQLLQHNTSDQQEVDGQGSIEQNKHQNFKKKSGIYDEDEQLDLQNNSRNKKRDQQNEQAGNVSETDHIKMNFFEPGLVNFDFVPPKINFFKTAGMQTFSKKNIQSLTGNDIADIRKLLFSQSQNKFLPTSWSQGFILNDSDDCFYGLFQKEGGPCGVIACVQAFYLKYLFYVYPTTSNNAGRNLTDYKNKTLRENCLVAALAEILFNCRGDDNIIRLAIIQNTSTASSIQQSIPIENCGFIPVKVQSIEQAYEAVHQYKTDYIGQHNNGVTTFLYSVILTKGVKNIQQEMDIQDNSLIGHHGHCSQEQVNLFLTGKARSNCFDGEKILDGDFKLKGIDQRAPFGFLTIFEHLKYIEVGSNLKTPLFPIWIICKEYHYSVIFAKDFRANEKSQQPHFDLVYYDELYNPQDRIILTVTQKKYAKQSYTSSSASNQQHFLFNRNGKSEDDEDMIPVIELVMRTKWGKEISVDWNGTQPIL